jgi:hypothetical protein
VRIRRIWTQPCAPHARGRKRKQGPSRGRDAASARGEELPRLVWRIRFRAPLRLCCVALEPLRRRIVSRTFCRCEIHIASLDGKTGELGVRHLTDRAAVHHRPEGMHQPTVLIVRVRRRQAEPVCGRGNDQGIETRAGISGGAVRQMMYLVAHQQREARAVTFEESECGMIGRDRQRTHFLFIAVECPHVPRQTHPQAG